MWRHSLRASRRGLAAAATCGAGGAWALPIRCERLEGDPLSPYDVGPILGEGAFAVVKRVTSRATGEEFALKLVDKRWTLAGAMQHELSVLRAVGRHKHIVSLIDSFELKDTYGVVLELAGGGEVFDRICERGTYSEHDAAALVRQVALALEHMHAAGVCHRDLKPENLLLVDRSDDAPIKVCDFGLSAFYGAGRPPLTRPAGTVAYMAPEVVSHAAHGPAVDLWALGVVLFIVLGGYHPFDPFGVADDAKLVREIKAGRWGFGDAVWDNVSAEAKAVVARLLAAAPAERPSAAELLALPWVRGETAPTASLAPSAERLRAFNEARRTWRAAAAAAAMVARVGPGEAEPPAPTGGGGGGGGGAGGGGGDAGGDAGGGGGGTLSAEAREEMRVAFGAFDRDGSGAISAEELRQAMARLGLGEADARAAMRRVDSDADGTITFAEFSAALAPVYAQNRQMLRRAFAIFDADGSGYIDRRELASMLSKLRLAPKTDEAFDALFRAADSNGDGLISFEEFLHMLGKDRLQTSHPVRGARA